MERIERIADTHSGIIGQLAAFVLGFAEGTGGFGMTYEDSPWSPRSIAYDRGRSLRQAISGAPD